MIHTEIITIERPLGAIMFPEIINFKPNFVCSVYETSPEEANLIKSIAKSSKLYLK